MPTSLSAKKRVRQNLKRRARNRQVKSVVRSQIKTYLSILEGGDADAARQALRSAAAALDKAVSKGVLHKKTASRRKSRLAAKLKQVAAPASQS